MPDLDSALDRLSPATSADDAALGRAYQRLATEMHAEPVVARPLRRSVDVRRRVVGTMAMAAAAAAVIAGVVVATPQHRTSSAANDSSRALMQIAGYYRSLPSATAGYYVKITRSGTTASSSLRRAMTDVTYRPADLGNTTNPWVSQHVEGGKVVASVSARCDGFAFADVADDPCQPGTWVNPTPEFLATLAAQSPDAVAAGLLGFLKATTTPGAGIAPAALFWAFTVLEEGAGDNALAANVMRGLAVVAEHDSSMTATRTATGYRVEVRGGPAGNGVETLSVDLATAAIAYAGSNSAGSSVSGTITTAVVGAGDVPAAEPYSPVPVNGGSQSNTPSPSALPTH